MADAFTLRVASEGTDAPIELRLSMEPPARDAEAAGSVHRPVCADRRAVFSLPADGLDDVAVTLAVNGVTVPTDNRIENDRLVLRPYDGCCFADICGIAVVSLRFARRETAESYRIYAEPVLICVPEGPEADNILRMADEVVSRWGEIFTESTSAPAGVLPGTGKGFADRLKNHLKQLSDIVLLYESHLGYFAVSGRTVLKDAHRIEGFERLTDFTDETAQYIATHPEELMPHRGKAGVFVGSGVYMPRRTLVRTAEASFDTPENRAVGSFPLTVGEAVRTECRRIEAVLEGLADSADMPGYVAPGLAVVTEAGRRLRETLDSLKRIERRLRAISLKAAGIFAVSAAVMRRPPQPTPVFVSVPAYRTVWNAMRAWFGRTDPVYEAEAAMVLSVERSSLYEYFVLFRLIDALRAQGFELQSSRRHLWTNAGSLYTQTEHENTFVFARGETALTLWFQPVIAGHRYTGENGLEMKRRSSWSMKEDEFSGVVAEQAVNAYWTPDYVMKIEEKGRTRYALLDAKLSSVWSVMRNQVPYLAYRYLTCTGCMNPEDRHLGLWLICGHPNPKDRQVGALFDLADGMPFAPGIQFVRAAATDGERLNEAVTGILAA